VAAVGRGLEQVDVEEQVARRQRRQDVVGDVAAQHLRAALRIGVRQPQQPADGEREAGARDPAPQRPVGRQDRRRVVAARDRAADGVGRLGQAQHLAGRRRAVSVDEADEVGVRARHRLHQHAALAQLGVLERDDALVARGVTGDDVRRPVAAVVERDDEPRVVAGADGAVAVQRRADPVLLVVGGHDDVEAQRDLPGTGCR
jgi:hypothetical protein